MSPRFVADVRTSEVADTARPGWFSQFNEPAFAVNAAWSLNNGISQPGDWFWALKSTEQEEAL